MPSILVRVLQLVQSGQDAETIRENGTSQDRIPPCDWSPYLTDVIPDIDLSHEDDKWWTRYRIAEANQSCDVEIEGKLGITGISL